MKISVIILNWNAAADTIRCVQAVSGWQQLQPDIWVVDNASADGSPTLISQACPGIHLICNPDNLGYTGGNNVGLVAALAGSSAPILLLNNDTVVAEADIIELIKALHAHPPIGLISPVLVDLAQPERVLAAGGQNMVWHLSSHRAQINPGDAIQRVDYVPGTVLLARAEVFKQVGLLDEAYFFAGELPDLCYRAGQAGYQSAVHTGVRAAHAVKRSAAMRETLFVYYIIRNRFLFIGKYYQSAGIFLRGFWTLYSVALALKLKLSGKRHTARAVWLGLTDGWRGQFGGQNERVLAVCQPQPKHLGLQNE